MFIISILHLCLAECQQAAKLSAPEGWVCCWQLLAWTGLSSFIHRDRENISGLLNLNELACHTFFAH